MGILTANTPVNMQSAGFWYGRATIESPTHLQISGPPLVQDYYGYGLTYAPNKAVTGGTITGTTLKANGALQYSVTGVNVSATAFFKAPTALVAEALMFSGNDTMIGSTGNDVLLSFAGNDILQGRGGNDTLNGGLGLDIFYGGTGNDTFVVNTALEKPIELAGQGTDTVRSTANYTLGTNLENLVLLGSAITGVGNTSNNQLTGTALSNSLYGGAGNDVLNGNMGADLLVGGIGNDTYFIDNIGDVASEAVNAGNDTVIVSALSAYTMSANIENLTMLSGVFTATGNNLSNTIDATQSVPALNLFLQGATIDGGLGADTMIGTSGNDTFYVDNIGDTIIGNGGNDVVFSSVSYALPTGFASLTLTGSALIATGNSGNNMITGNAQDNIINGGAGFDTMTGGGGNDTFVVSDAPTLDVVIANPLVFDPISGLAVSGIDTVQCTFAYWNMGANEDNLLLLGAALTGSGNDLNNVITGNTNSNTLNGQGGNDTLTGDLGVDTFIFSSTLNAASNIDTITDFTSGTDKIQLNTQGWWSFDPITAALIFNPAPFTGLTILPGSFLGAAQFVSGVGATANAATAQILYDTASGTLSFDADGTGIGIPTAFAQLTGIPMITTADFVVA